MKSYRRISRWRFVIDLFALCVAVGAVAQVAWADERSSADDGAGGALLDEIMVTAQKRTQSLQDVPLAISAFTAEAMQHAGVGDISDLSRLVPALEAESSTRVTTAILSAGG